MNPERPPSPAIALLRRELLVLSRNRGLFGTVAVMTGFLVVATVVLILWADSTHTSMANFARNLFRTQFFLLFAAALIVVPGAAASSMVSERRQDCFPLLYTTLIPPAWIVWSKALAMAGLFAGFFIGVLPFSGLVYFFAGMETDALLYSAVVLFSLALGTASIGLMASSWATNHGRALYLSGLGVAAMVMLPVFLRTAASILPLPSMPWLEYMGPTRAFSLVYGGLSGWVPCLFFALYQIGVATVALLIARGRVLPDRPGWRERIGNRFALPARRRSSPIRPLIDDKQNPIAAKERMVSTMARGHRPFALGLFGFGAGVFFSIPDLLMGGGTAGFSTSSMAGFIVSIMVPPIMAIQFMAEREQDMWDPLRCSLLSGRDIVWGKLRGVWIVLRPLVLGLVAGDLLVYAFGLISGAIPADLSIAYFAFIGVISTLVGFCTTSVFALYGATHRKTMTSAIVMAYVAAFGLPMLASIPTMMLFSTVFAIIQPGANNNNDFLLISQTLGLVSVLFNVILAYLIFLSTVRVVESKLAPSAN